MSKLYICEYETDQNRETFFVWAVNPVGAQRKAFAGLRDHGIKHVTSFSVKEVPVDDVRPRA